jgi:hypothetical protein
MALQMPHTCVQYRLRHPAQSFGTSSTAAAKSIGNALANSATT